MTLPSTPHTITKDKERERKRDRRNLNPHKPALVAMWIWGREYAAQRGGSMDFWDGLADGDKQTCRACLERLKLAPNEVTR